MAIEKSSFLLHPCAWSHKSYASRCGGVGSTWEHSQIYSFNEFKSKIEATGAEFISCDSYLPELTEKEESGLKSVSTTEIAIQDIRITLAPFLSSSANTSALSANTFLCSKTRGCFEGIR